MELFMDDFSVFGSSFDNCLVNLQKVLTRCEEKNLVLNWEKCHFMVTQGIILGHIISVEGIQVDRAKVDLITDLPICSFLGHVGFYRRFIKDISTIFRSLSHLLTKDAPFEWTEECQTSFKTLKTLLTTVLVLQSPDWSLPFRAHM